jgi:hypothetical protein
MLNLDLSASEQAILRDVLAEHPRFIDGYTAPQTGRSPALSG